MTAVVLDFTAAVSAFQNRRADPVKCVWLPLAVVQQAVMARMQAARNRQARTHFNRNPVPKFEPLLGQEGPERHIPFRQVVNEKGTARFQHADALCQLFTTPLDIVFVGQIVVSVFSVFLANVEWGVRKNRVDYFILDKRQYVQAVRGVQSTDSGDVIRQEVLPRSLQERAYVEIFVPVKFEKRLAHDC